MRGGGGVNAQKCSLSNLFWNGYGYLAAKKSAECPFFSFCWRKPGSFQRQNRRRHETKHTGQQSTAPSAHCASSRWVTPTRHKGIFPHSLDDFEKGNSEP